MPGRDRVQGAAPVAPHPGRAAEVRLGRLEAGQQVGVVRVWRSGNIAVETPVYAAEAIGTGSTVRRAIDGASELVIGMFRAGAEKL